MAENIPSIPGGVPPKPPESSKVQPKKETVRINLPPKPSAAPTIKLPTLPPGGPTGVVPPPPSSAVPAPSPTRASGAPATSAPISQTAPQPQRPAPARAPAAAASVSGLDKGLAIAAALVALAAIGSTVYCMMLFTPQ